jgi:HEAT repeat protein
MVDISKLIGLLDSGLHVRRSAIALLAKAGPEATLALPKLLVSATDESAEIRSETVYALGEIGDASAEVVCCLIRMCADNDPRVRFFSVIALGRLRPDHQGALQALVDAIRDEAQIDAKTAKLYAFTDQVYGFANESDGSPLKVSVQAAEALQRYGSRAAVVVPKLVELITHPLVRENTIRVLEAIGPPARDHALSALLHIAGDLEAEHQATALSSIAAIAPDDRRVLGCLRAALQSRNSSVRSLALSKLADCIAGAEVLDLIKKGLSDEDWHVRGVALRLLENAAEEVGAIDLSVKILADPRISVYEKDDILRRFSRCKGLPDKALPAVLDVMRNSKGNHSLLEYGTDVLIRHFQNRVEIVPFFAELLCNDSTFGVGRSHIISALGRFGANAAQAIPALLQNLRTNLVQVVAAIKQIDVENAALRSCLLCLLKEEASREETDTYFMEHILRSIASLDQPMPGAVADIKRWLLYKGSLVSASLCEQALKALWAAGEENQVKIVVLDLLGQGGPAVPASRFALRTNLLLPKDVIPFLESAMDKDSLFGAEQCIELAAELQFAEFLPLLQKAIDPTYHPQVRIKAFYVLVQIGGVRRAYVQPILDSLTNEKEHDFWRKDYAVLLGQTFSPAGDETTRAGLGMLLYTFDVSGFRGVAGPHSDDEEVSAVRDDVARTFMRMLSHESNALREGCHEGLALIGADSAGVIAEFLISDLEEPRRASVSAMASFGIPMSLVHQMLQSPAFASKQLGEVTRLIQGAIRDRQGARAE